MFCLGQLVKFIHELVFIVKTNILDDDGLNVLIFLFFRRKYILYHFGDHLSVKVCLGDAVLINEESLHLGAGFQDLSVGFIGVTFEFKLFFRVKIIHHRKSKIMISH